MDVKALRRQLGWTQEKLAEKAYTTPRTIIRWEQRDVMPNLQGRARLREIAKEWQREQARKTPERRQFQAEEESSRDD